MKLDLWAVYRKMLMCRRFEESVASLWHEGKILGEMHLGVGEEAVTAGVLEHLREGDAMALDHRGTAPLLLAGADPRKILLECMGHPQGLCSGMGGHMHLFSPEHLAASSGIVGSSGPAAVGFALAGKRLRPGSVSIAFFGEGAFNQGMMMEAMNLSASWKLPVLFVCKDNGWAITTKSASMTGGTPSERARALGLEAAEVDGCDVEAVWTAAEKAFGYLRAGKGPYMLHARCIHLEGHFLGDALLRIVRKPIPEMTRVSGPMLRAGLRPGGAPISERLRILMNTASLGPSFVRTNNRKKDPLIHMGRILSDSNRRRILEKEVDEDIKHIFSEALAEIEVNV